MLIDEILENPHLVQDVITSTRRVEHQLPTLREASRFEFSDLRPMFEADIDGKPDQNWEMTRDAFAAIPPYPVTWCEFAGSRYSGRARLGYLFASTRADAAGFRWPQKAIFREDVDLYDSRNYYVSVHGYYKADGMGGKIGLIPYMGLYVATRTGEPATFCMAPYQSTEEWKRFTEEEREGVTRLSLESFFCQYCFNLLACKNVEIAEKPIDEKLQKARLRRGKKPLLSMYTLKINMPKTGAFKKEQRDPNNETVMKRFHAVRGHFAHYTEEKPLFGKHTGRFFVPAHTRGSKDLGEIRKDYKGVAK